MFSPSVLIAMFSLLVGLLVRWTLIDYGYIRILLAFFTTTVAFVLLSWRVGLTRNERNYLVERISVALKEGVKSHE